MQKSIIVATTVAMCVSYSTNCLADAISDHSGWFIGLGLMQTFSKQEGILSDSKAYGGVQYNKAKLFEANPSKMGLVLCGGYCHIIYDSYYIGAELSCNFTKSSLKSTNTKLRGFFSLKSQECLTTIATKLGKYLSFLDSLIYLKGGFTYNKSSLYVDFLHDSVKSYGMSPIIGIGIEKHLFNKCNIRFDCDCRLPKNHTVYDARAFRTDGRTVFNYKATVQHKAKSYAMQMTFVYHF